MLKNRLTTLRKNLGKSQKDIAQYLGITQQAYGLYETGKSEPNATSLVKLCKLYNVTSDYLLGLSNYPTGETLEMPTDEKEFIISLIEMYLQLTPEVKKTINSWLNSAIINSGYTKKSLTKEQEKFIAELTDEKNFS